METDTHLFQRRAVSERERDKEREKKMGKEKECGDGVRKPLFERYEMGRVLGQGTFAKVYHGRDLRTGESVAVKVINKDHVRREARMADQIQREITVMRLVRHPHVVELKEVLATRCRIYFVMEYVRGGELFARVARGRLPEDQARCYFHQLISAVDFCHSRGVSHRDLKPENVLLDEEGNIKVSDFGLSALPEQLRHDGLLHTQCGTPAYVAPEVLRKKGYDGATSDLWSCGVILFVLLAGFLPFQDENLMRMYRKVFKAEYQTPPWFSSDGRRLVSRLLVADPAKRISIPAIMRHAWFKRGRSLPPLRYLPAPPSPLPPPDDGAILTDEEKAEDKGSPRFHNAFELIATMSLGFNLSGLFESGRKSRTVFASRAGAETIVERLEAVGKKLGFEVQRAKGGCSVHMEKRSEGPKGWLAVTVEVCEVAPQVAFVELRKSSGDTLEYAKFCEEDVRPGIQDIVWTWKGDDTASDRRETT